MVFRVKIGNEPVPEPEIFARDRLGGGAALPRLLAHKFVGGGMQTVDGREHAELQPSDIELIVFIAEMMPAYIVAPPGIAHVRRRRRHIGLEFERAPGHEGVARKAHGIAMAPLFGIAGENERALALVFLIEEMIVVERPERIEPGNVADLALLPIYPPKIHAVFFVRAMNVVEIGFDVILVCQRKTYLLFARRIHTDRLCHLFIHILEKSHARGGVHVERDAVIHLFQLAQHRLIVGKEIGVPAISRPTGHSRVIKKFEDGLGRLGTRLFAEFFHDIHPMPIHVDRRDGERQFFALEAAHEREIFFLSIRLISAPPITQGKARQKRDLAAELEKVGYAGAVFAAVGKIIFIRTFGAGNYLVAA